MVLVVCLFAWAIYRQDYWTGLLPAFAVIGLGIGLMGSTIAAAVVNSVPEEKTGAASGINNMLARASFLCAVVIFGAVVSYLYGQNIRNSSLGSNDQKTDDRKRVWTTVGRCAVSDYYS